LSTQHTKHSTACRDWLQLLRFRHNAQASSNKRHHPSAKAIFIRHHHHLNRHQQRHTSPSRSSTSVKSRHHQQQQRNSSSSSFRIDADSIHSTRQHPNARTASATKGEKSTAVFRKKTPCEHNHHPIVRKGKSLTHTIAVSQNRLSSSILRIRPSVANHHADSSHLPPVRYIPSVAVSCLSTTASIKTSNTNTQSRKHRLPAALPCVQPEHKHHTSHHKYHGSPQTARATSPSSPSTKRTFRPQRLLKSH